jgi:hypothetical protein
MSSAETSRGTIPRRRRSSGLIRGPRFPCALTSFYELLLRLQCTDWSLNTVTPDGRGAALWQRGDHESGPYQSPMEDGMEQFHAWYRRAMGAELTSGSDTPPVVAQHALNSVVVNVAS